MPFPSQDRTIYKKNPLVEVVCQLRFPSILRIKKGIPDEFQETIISQFFNLKETENRMLTIDNDGNIEDTEETKVYNFFSGDNTKVVALSHDFIALTDYDYKKWDDFKEGLELAFNAFNDIYSPSFFSRIGLRYKNVIRKELVPDTLDADWGRLIKPPLSNCFVDENLDKDLIKGYNGRLLIDLENENAELNMNYGLVQKQESDEIGFIIDNDFFTKNDCKTEGIDNVFTKLETFKRKSHDCFKWCISDELDAAMEPEELPE